LIKFDVEKTVQYCFEGAEYDMGVAKAMYEKGKYPYALFMGHLALEKLLKALVVKTTRKHAPYTHSLPLLADRSGIQIPEKTIKSLARFMEFHFEARYPDEQQNFYKKRTKKFATQKLQEIREAFIWLKERL
jgi:HEPN domain-containing protein